MSYDISPLLDILSQNADAENASAMSAYMRELFPFYGIKKPQRAQLLKAFFAEHGFPEVEDVPEVVWELWLQPERECQYIAMTLLEKRIKKLPVTTLALIEQLIVTKSWWDTVDGLLKYAGALFKRFPGSQEQYLLNWRKSDDFWLRRSAILFQLAYKADTDVELLFTIIRENLGSKEFFINKAIGWALREYSKIDAERVINFVDKTELEPLSRREALKWLKNKGMLE